MKQTVIDDESVMNANEAANSLIIKSNNDLDALEQINFNGFKLSLKKVKLKSMLGCLNVEFVRFEFQSTILTDNQMRDSNGSLWLYRY